MSKVNQIRCFLNEINTKNSKDAIELLKTITEELEIKNDPDPIEIEIVSNSYQLLEKLATVQELLRLYLNENRTLDGSILNKLYDRNNY